MDRRYRDASFLEQRYLDEGQSASDIAETCGVTSNTVSRATVSSVSHAPKTRTGSPGSTSTWGRRQQDIADDCGVTKATISHWLSRHD